MARRGLQHVPGDEPGQAPAAGQRVAATAIATSRAARAAAGAPTWCPAMAAAAAVKGHFVDIRSGNHEGVETITGRVSVLNRDDVDTDQIIPKQFLKRSLESASATSCSATGPSSPAGTCPGTRCWWPAATSAAARVASTRPGRSRITAFRRSSRRASPTSSAPTAPRSGCSRSSCPPMTARRSPRRGRPRSIFRTRRCRWPGGGATFEIDPQIKHRLLNGLDDIAATLAEDSERSRRLRARPASARARRPRRCDQQAVHPETGTRQRMTASPTSRPAGAVELDQRLALRGDEVVLDAGCGSGRVTAQIADLVREGASTRSTCAVDGQARPRRSATAPRCSARTWSSSSSPSRWMRCSPTPRSTGCPTTTGCSSGWRRRSSPAGGSWPSAAAGATSGSLRVWRRGRAHRPLRRTSPGWTGPVELQVAGDRSGQAGRVEASGADSGPREVSPADPRSTSCGRCASLRHLDPLPEELRDPFVDRVLRLFERPFVAPSRG